MTNRWVLGARPRTLPAAVVPVAVGTAAAVGDNPGGIVAWRAAAAMVVALALQVATNYVNDYADGDRGTDEVRVGPTRLVAGGLATSGEVKRAALAAFAVAGVAGLALAVDVGWELLAVGAASMLAGWAYTGGPNPYGYLGLGELFVFVFFGVVATAGSGYVQSEALTGLALGASVPVGFLAVALLVINNLRDIPTDTVSGKRTLSVRIGDRASRWVYAALLAGVGIGVVLIGLDRPPALLGLVGLVAAVPPLRAVLGLGRPAAEGPALIPVLGQTGQVQLAVGAGLTLGLALGG